MAPMSSSPMQVTSSPRVIACVLLLSIGLLASHVSADKRIILRPGKSRGRKDFITKPTDPQSAVGKEFNVVSHGAKGDGNTADTKAFLQAWEAACNAPGSVTVVVPEGKTFLVGPIKFNGPCKAASIVFQIAGKIVAPGSVDAWKGADREHWLGFFDVNKLTLSGGGTFDGQGPVWWKCREQKSCNGLAPVGVYLSKCNALSIRQLNFVNSPGVHTKVIYSKNVRISNLHFTAPDDSPNTDGINVSSSEIVEISSSNIQTGDDCISIIGTTRGVNITDIKCGPGHGISIGSLGKNGATDSVQDVHVKNAEFLRTDNGVRIKTYEGGRGIVKNVVYEQLNFTETRNPIIIDQFYCNRGDCPSKPGAVTIEDVRVIGARGTTPDDIAINLKCSKGSCSRIYFKDVNIRSSDPKKKATSFCSNSEGIAEANIQPPVPCLQSASPVIRKSHY